MIPSNEAETNKKETKMESLIWERPANSGRRTCMLMITHACNLNCTYCYEKHKSNRTMPFELAKELILRECKVVQDDPRFHELEIDLMGGEPMMNFDLIKQLVEWAETNPLPVPYIFFIVTNGTLFDRERKEWFRKYKDVITVGVSYDGTPEMQRKNRDTAKDSIDMDFFHGTWPEQWFHMTISQETLPYLAEGILKIQHKGYPLEASLAQGVNWTDCDAQIYLEQLQMLSTTYLSEPVLRPINLLSRVLNIQPSSKIISQKQDKWCGSGTHMVTYDVDGKAYGCHLFTTVVLGEEAKERDKIQWCCAEATEDPYCRKCVLKLSCPTCAGFNYRYRGDIAKRDHNWCKMVFAEKFAACEFQIKVLAQRRDELNETDALHAKGAIEAYKVLKSLNLDNVSSPFVYS